MNDKALTAMHKQVQSFVAYVRGKFEVDSIISDLNLHPSSGVHPVSLCVILHGNAVCFYAYGNEQGQVIVEVGRPNQAEKYQVSWDELDPPRPVDGYADESWQAILLNVMRDPIQAIRFAELPKNIDSAAMIIRDPKLHVLLKPCIRGQVAVDKGCVTLWLHPELWSKTQKIEIVWAGEVVRVELLDGMSTQRSMVELQRDTVLAIALQLAEESWNNALGIFEVLARHRVILKDYTFKRRTT